MTNHEEESGGKNPPVTEYGGEDFVRVVLPDELAGRLSELFREAGFAEVAAQEIAVIAPLSGSRAAIMLPAGDDMNQAEVGAANASGDDHTILDRSVISLGNSCYRDGCYKCCEWYFGSTPVKTCWRKYC